MLSERLETLQNCSSSIQSECKATATDSEINDMNTCATAADDYR